MQFCKSIKYIYKMYLNSLFKCVYVHASSSTFFHESLENSLSLITLVIWFTNVCLTRPRIQCHIKEWAHCAVGRGPHEHRGSMLIYVYMYQCKAST